MSRRDVGWSMTRDDQELELRALAAELVEVQDQLLAFYDLAGALRGHLDPGPLLTALVTEAMRLIRATARPSVGLPDRRTSPGQRPAVS
jgi:hypothetical protein